MTSFQLDFSDWTPGATPKTLPWSQGRTEASFPMPDAEMSLVGANVNTAATFLGWRNAVFVRGTKKASSHLGLGVRLQTVEFGAAAGDRGEWIGGIKTSETKEMN